MIPCGQWLTGLRTPDKQLGAGARVLCSVALPSIHEFRQSGADCWVFRRGGGQQCERYVPRTSARVASAHREDAHALFSPGLVDKHLGAHRRHCAVRIQPQRSLAADCCQVRIPTSFTPEATAWQNSGLPAEGLWVRKLRKGVTRWQWVHRGPPEGIPHSSNSHHVLTGFRSNFWKFQTYLIIAQILLPILKGMNMQFRNGGYSNHCVVF